MWVATRTLEASQCRWQKGTLREEGGETVEQNGKWSTGGKGSKTWKRGTGNKKMSKQKAIYQN